MIDFRKNDSLSDGYITDGPLNYSASSRCTWIIESATRDALVLKLEDFFTECCWDHLYVYDGDSVNDNLIAAFRFASIIIRMFAILVAI